MNYYNFDIVFAVITKLSTGFVTRAGCSARITKFGMYITLGGGGGGGGAGFMASPYPNAGFYVK